MFTEIVATKTGLFLSIKEYENIEPVILEIKERINNLKKLLEEGDKIGLLLHENFNQNDLLKILEAVEENGIKVFSIQFGKPVVQFEDEKKELLSFLQREPTIFLTKNIRSGQRFEFNGNVVIFGNVSFGAELIVGGHLIVFGTIRGNVTAGKIIGDKALIACVEFNPTNLKIGQYVLRDKQPKNYPCIVHVRNGRIIVEDYSQFKDDIFEV